jgi:hypothetical protein
MQAANAGQNPIEAGRSYTDKFSPTIFGDFPVRVEVSMLSFELSNEGRAIQISCDSKGLAALIAALEEVRSSGHLHLRAPSNGGRELSKKNPWGKDAIGEVIITTGGD